MNEQIEKILEEVGGYGTKALIHPEDVEKFAQLIVQECMEIAVKGVGEYELPMTPETRRSWNIWINIKEHFGVKK